MPLYCGIRPTACPAIRWCRAPSGDVLCPCETASSVLFLGGVRPGRAGQAWLRMKKRALKMRAPQIAGAVARIYDR